MKIKITALVLCLLFGGRLWAASGSGANFLKIGVGARAISMGSAYTAVADDATAAYWNPAGLSQLHHREVMVTHAEWLDTIRYDYATYVHPLKNATLAASVGYLSQGTIQGRGENRQRQGDFGARDMVATFSVSKRMSATASAGMNVKILEQKIGTERAQGWALDFGALRKLAGDRISVGFSMQNLGSKISFMEESSNLPLSVSGGIMVRIIEPLLIASDVRHLVYDQNTEITIGTEYRPFSNVAFRSGYLAQMGGKSPSLNKINSGLSRLTGFTFGAGFRVLNLDIDYALAPSGELGETHHFSISFPF